MREVVAVFQRERRDQRQEIRVELETTDGVDVEAAGGQLRQIVWNLLRNAADAMPSGGTIAVNITTGEDADGGAGGTDANNQRWVRLTFADSGSGIPKADLDRIFEPFFSTKNGGTGLGLPTVARIVDDHHGTIEVESEVGRGTTVAIRLPAAPAQARGAMEHAA